MRGLTLAWFVAATPLRGQVSAGPGADVSAAERGALEQLGEANATIFELVDSWFAGRPIQYYHFGRDAARPTILYRVRGRSDAVTTLPGLEGYSALRAVYVVEPKPGVDAPAVRSQAQIEDLVRRGLARLAGPGTVINAPIVPQGSRLDRDPAERTVLGAWYRGHRVSYYDLGPVSAVAIPLLVFISEFDENGEGVPVDGQPSNASAVPGVAGYSDMWQIRLVLVGDRFEPGSYRDHRRALADARAGRFQLMDPGVVVNCPVMYLDGKPAAR
ncbi:MAG: hypothetical protein HYT81_02845 [Gemmatimonadetes bacterium]|nr:hypothetical protein [Gemmatimonadota bacterium]